MPKQFILECSFDVPTDPFEQADALTLIKKPWAALTDALKGLGVPFEQRAELVEPRSEPRAPSGVKRQGRPPGSRNRTTRSPREIAQPIRPSPQPAAALDVEDEDLDAAE